MDFQLDTTIGKVALSHSSAILIYEGLWGGAYSQSIIIDVHDVPSVFSYVASYVPIHQLKL